MFTPDLYPTISLVPASAKRIRFVKGVEVFSMIFMPLLLLVGFIVYDIFWQQIDPFIEEGLEDGSAYFVIGVISLIIILLLIRCLKGLVHIKDAFRYKLNVDYIEETNYELARVAKAGKLGLFNQTKNKLLLLPRYEKIEKFDSKHILIGNNRYIGLYSVPVKKVIIPVECDAISPEKDGIIEVTINGTKHHFDALGNRLI